MEQQILRETLSITSVQVTDEDKALGHEVNRVMWRALAQADRYLTHGPEPARLAITKAFLTMASRFSAIDSNAVVEQSRVQLLSTLSKMQSIDTNASDTPALAGRPDDQDE
jgi:hypothetical protein